MSVTFNRQVNKSGHVRPRRPDIDIYQPGRLRTAHVLSLCSISHSSLYNRMNDGSFPRPDGRDGNRNYWRTDTIREFLKA
jgi:predicted DNA-binding transcriptional regulator AlpA